MSIPGQIVGAGVTVCNCQGPLTQGGRYFTFTSLKLGVFKPLDGILPPSDAGSLTPALWPPPSPGVEPLAAYPARSSLSPDPGVSALALSLLNPS